MKMNFGTIGCNAWKRALLGFALMTAPIAAMANDVLDMDTARVAVKEQLIKAGDGLKLDTLVISPSAESVEPVGVLVMTHGFLLNQNYYRDVLAQVADQGFVVIAPQAYASGGLPFGKPTTEVEAKNVAAAVTWFSTRLEGIVGRPVAFDKLAMISHSRGSKVAWTIMRDKLLPLKAIAAIDPVDGTQDGSGRVTGGSLQASVPTFIIGTGLGGKSAGFGPACAPSDASYAQFWSTAKVSPSWLLVANDYGHMDFLDDANKCGLICSLCTKATSANPKGDFRSWIASGIGDFMRGVLNKDAAALEALEQTSTLINATVQKL